MGRTSDTPIGKTGKTGKKTSNLEAYRNPRSVNAKDKSHQRPTGQLRFSLFGPTTGVAVVRGRSHDIFTAHGHCHAAPRHKAVRICFRQPVICQSCASTSTPRPSLSKLLLQADCGILSVLV